MNSQIQQQVKLGIRIFTYFSTKVE